MELPENTGINEYAIVLVEGKQLSYEPIYTFSLVELKTLKTYIETHLKINLLSHWQVLLFSLTKNPMKVSNCILIIKVLIIWLPRIDIHFCWMVNC